MALPSEIPQICERQRAVLQGIEGVKDDWSLAVDPGAFLVPVNYSHSRELFQLINQNRRSLSKWLPWVIHVVTPADLHKLIRYYRQKNQDSGAFTCCVISHYQVAGILSINHINRENYSASLGYWLGSEFRRAGLMRRCCVVVMNHLFRTTGLHKVVIRCAVDNINSQRIPESLGFKREALLRDGEWLNDRYVDLYSYGMLARQWQQRDLPEKRQSPGGSYAFSGEDF